MCICTRIYVIYTYKVRVELVPGLGAIGRRILFSKPNTLRAYGGSLRREERECQHVQDSLPFLKKMIQVVVASAEDGGW